jgi:16S rRNA (cytidine1402-2'-O)-methyltransferase
MSLREPASGRGCLYLVATPIGNLEDITLRALRVLKEADLVACEDTRQTRKLLTHFGLRKRLVSYHEHNEAERARELLGELRQGAQVALVSDAGTPLVSDPGERLLRLCIQEGIRVVPIPGASALVAALAASGLPAGEFTFAGFLPARLGERRRALTALARRPGTIIFYEAPHRLLAALRDMLGAFGNRPAAIARELTKMHEEILRGRLSELLGELEARASVRGEITVLVGPGEPGEAAAAPPAAVTPLAERVAELIREQGLERKAALKQAARERGLTRRQAYRELLAQKGE